MAKEEAEKSVFFRYKIMYKECMVYALWEIKIIGLEKMYMVSWNMAVVQSLQMFSLDTLHI